MKKKFLAMMAVSMMGLLMLSACQTNKKTADSATTETTAKTEVTVKDTNGQLTVPKNPQKVVVFDNGSLDTMDALGVGDRVVGAPTKNIPAYLKKYQKVESAGGIKEPDLEKINQLKPDLIIISGRQQDYQEQLKAIAPTIYLAVDAKNPWASTKQNIETLGTIFDKAEASANNALVVLVNEGQLSAYGKGSRFGLIHDTFGFKAADDKIEASTHGQSVSYEYVLEKNPGILFVVDRTKAIGGDDSKDNVAANELIQKTDAGKNDKVIMLQPDVWYLSGGGLESMHLMIEDVKKGLE